MLTVKSSSGNCLTLLRAHDSTWPGNFPAFPSFPIWIPFVRISDACPLEILICKLSNKTAYGKWQTAADCRTRWQVNLIYNRARVIHLGQTPASCKWQPPTLYLYFLVFSIFLCPSASVCGEWMRAYWNASRIGGKGEACMIFDLWSVTKIVAPAPLCGIYKMRAKELREEQEGTKRYLRCPWCGRDVSSRSYA